MMLRAAALCLLAFSGARAGLVDTVHALVAGGNLGVAERLVRASQSQGINTETAAALSWVARGCLDARQFDHADSLAMETDRLSRKLLGVRRIDADPWLPMAVGAAIEVHARVLAARHETSDALLYLREQLGTWGTTSLHERIQKNINLLTLEGKPAPRLQGIDLSAYRGRPVLLFFWAHWCPDCKADVGIIASVMRRFQPQRLALIGPTRLYGYVAGGDPATPAVERPYIEKIRQQYYAPLAGMAVPLSAANFEAYGASTTPTIVLVDRAGVVRFYHPGAVTEAQLTEQVQAVLKR